MKKTLSIIITGIILITGVTVQSFDGENAGKIIDVNYATGEIRVGSTDAAKGIIMGTKLYVWIGEEIAIMNAYFPMLSFSKCQLFPAHAKHLHSITKGMQVYFYVAGVEKMDVVVKKKKENDNSGKDIKAASLGVELPNPQIKDADNNPAYIPGYGTKVIGLFYTDTEASESGNPMADTLKAKEYPEDVYSLVTIVNMKDSSAPDFMIRYVMRNRIKKFNSVIMADVDLTIPKTWGLGDCNDKSVFVLIGMDRKVKYIKVTDKINIWESAEMNSVVKTIDDLLKK